jgi:hypothetical protein
MIKRKWEVCPHNDKGTRWSSLYVTMNTKGWISLSKFTFEKLGEPERVRVLYERSTNTVGIEAVSTLTTDAFRLGKKWSGGRVIYALRLIQEFRLKVPRSLRFMNPEFDENGILILDLNDTRPAQKGQNGRGRSAENN